MLVVLAGVGLLTQLAIAPAPAQEMAQPKITGKIADKTIKEFTDLNLPGVKKVKYARLTLGPNASISPMVANEGTDLCVALSGSITSTARRRQEVHGQRGRHFHYPDGLQGKDHAGWPTGIL